MMLPPDHPSRLSLANEVHARPSQPLDTPSRASYVAVLIAPQDRERELAHISGLCESCAVEPPAAGATHFSANLGAIRFKWERHGEFSGYTMSAPSLTSQPFSDPVALQLPAGWLAGLPGTTIVAAHLELVAAEPAPPDAAMLARYFGGNIVVGGEVAGGAGLAYTDFRIHPDGFGRFLVCNRSLTLRQAGRTAQRLFEIEAYRMMALLALPLARSLGPRISTIEGKLAELTSRIAVEGGDDESLLHDLTRLAAEIESSLSTSQFRFGACRAYDQLVTTRIRELREIRVPGVEPIEEFMARRLAPAVATCATASKRLHGLSERVAQASALLSTRVDIASERQNQALLASMDRRARLQLRLQQTVEGLSVAAIVYYVAGLLGYLAKAGKAGGLAVHPDLVVGMGIPVVALFVILAVRRARHRAHDADAVKGPPSS